MGRVGRNDILYDGCFAHVISRSIRKMKLFNDHEDFEKFKEYLAEVKRKRNFKLLHYCIMKTHFHLAIEMSDVKEFSHAVRDLKRSYVYWFHKKYKISGPMWRERFRSLLIENENYLYTCGKYIENNPLRAGLVKENQDWKYSSYRHYERGIADDLIDQYEDFVEEIKGLAFDKEEFENGRVIGSNFFKFQLKETHKIIRHVP